MIFNVYPASGFLSQFVHFYWIMEIDEIVTPTAPNRVVPNGSVNLFFHYGDVLKNKRQDNCETMQYRSQISGQTTEYFDVYHTGKSSFLSVVFRPSGASLFFDIPIDIIINQHIDISSIDSRNSAFICEQLYHAPSSHQKIAVIEEYLIRNFQEKKLYNHQRISSAIKEAISCGGAISSAPSIRPSADGVLISLNTPEIDTTLKVIDSKGGTVITPKTKIEAEGRGWFAVFIDCEGNKIGLYQDLPQ